MVLYAYLQEGYLRMFLDSRKNCRFQGHSQKSPNSCDCELAFEHSDYFFVNWMYTVMYRYNCLESILYGSSVEMPGRKARQEKRSYCNGTEGVRSKLHGTEYVQVALKSL